MLEEVKKKFEINDLEGVTDIIITELGNMEYTVYDNVLLINSEAVNKKINAAPETQGNKNKTS